VDKTPGVRGFVILRLSMTTQSRVLRTLFFVGGFLIGAGLFAFLVYRSGPETVLHNLLAFGIVPLVGFILISLSNFCLYTFRWKLILDQMVPKEERVPFHRLFLHRMSGFAAGYLTPAAQVAGEPIRVAMLHSDGIPLKQATSSVILDLAFEITAFVLYVAMGLGFAFASGVGGGQGLLWSVILISVLLVILIGFFIATITGNGFFHRMLALTRLNRFKPVAQFELWLKETEALMSQFFVKKTGIIVLVIVLSLLMAAFKAVEAIFIAYFLGVHIGVTDAFLMSTLPGVALLLPVPGGLGVFEGSNAAMFALLGLSIDPIAYTIVIRLRDFLFIAIGVTHAIASGEKIVGGYKTKRS
jgi:uncharacterized protein (TIRG00374 family)